MAIIDVVRYQGNDEEFCWKFPSEDLRLGTQLVVKTAQTAFFVKGGKILDQFDPGTYTLKTGNIPLLNKIINIPFGGNSPFQAEIWFVNLINKLDNKWGTLSPIQIEDPKYGIIVPVRAFGQFGFKIVKPRKFIETLVGTMQVYSAHKIVEYFKGKLISEITTAIGKKMIQDEISVLQISMLLDEMSQFCENNIKAEFAKFGIEIINFYFMSINVPENDPSIIELKSAKAKAALIRTIGKDVYQFDKSTDVLKAAAENEGQAGNMMGAGMGLGMGLGVGGAMGGQMANIGGQMNTELEQQSMAKCTKCNTTLQANSKFCNNCGETIGQINTTVQVKKIKCDKCGFQFAETSKFCPECGDIYNPCGKCGADNPLDVNICIECSANMPIRCSKCDAKAEANAKFCPRCGNAMQNNCINCKTLLKSGALFCPECGTKQE
jgi:membrane protease subunit (stomatin/prohibitin family)